MSWLFSRALVEASLGANSLDGEPSAPSNGSHIPQAYCAPDKTTAFSRLSRFGMTFKPLTEDRGEALLMSYRAAFPVKTSPLPTSTGTDSTGSGQGCGERWRGWLAKYDHASSSWRTAQCSLLSEEPESLAILPRSGMTRDGLLWELPMSARPIRETGYGLWPTPSGTSNHGKNHVIGRMDEWGGSSNPFRGTEIARVRCASFEEWMMGWPTGWSALTASETDKYPSVPQQPGDI